MPISVSGELVGKFQGWSNLMKVNIHGTSLSEVSRLSTIGIMLLPYGQMYARKTTRCDPCSFRGCPFIISHTVLVYMFSTLLLHVYCMLQLLIGLFVPKAGTNDAAVSECLIYYLIEINVFPTVNYGNSIVRTYFSIGIKFKMIW